MKPEKAKKSSFLVTLFYTIRLNNQNHLFQKNHAFKMYKMYNQKRKINNQDDKNLDVYDYYGSCTRLGFLPYQV